MRIAKAALSVASLVASTGAFAQAASPEAGSKQGAVQLAPFSVSSGTTANRSVTPNASAPPLTAVYVYAVGSTQYGGYEYPPQGAYITTGDHGGAQLRVVIWEQGYANTSSRIAKMNGTQLPSAYLETALCGTSTTTPQSCGSGQTVTGYLEYYNADGYQSGSFTYQATSLVFPNTVRNTSINIK